MFPFLQIEFPESECVALHFINVIVLQDRIIVINPFAIII